MAVIDEKKLPARALFDTGVVIRGILQRKDSDTETCKNLWTAMLQAKCDILIAAPTVAEMVRGHRNGPPEDPLVEVVAFDEDAAYRLGTRLPEQVLEDLRESTGSAEHYIKYDAMIVACAIRHGADCIVTLDKGMIAIAKKAGMIARLPSYFHSDQQSLPLATPAALETHAVIQTSAPEEFEQVVTPTDGAIE